VLIEWKRKRQGRESVCEREGKKTAWKLAWPVVILVGVVTVEIHSSTVKRIIDMLSFPLPVPHSVAPPSPSSLGGSFIDLCKY